MRLVAQTAFGSVILWLLVIGFAGMTLWRLSEAIWGAADADGRKASKRLASLARAVFYARGHLRDPQVRARRRRARRSSDTQSQDLTAAALKHKAAR